ncbi:MAG: tetratricopeptide repeat protein [Candidatus Eremiobacteraeota bacterium]|nr:tetratricopeptide repeat protein [Candidatus Eremiobacteraeota bacterium]
MRSCNPAIAVMFLLAMAIAILVALYFISGDTGHRAAVLKDVISNSMKACDAREAGDYKTAIEYGEKAVRASSRLPEDNPEVAMSRSMLGELYSFVGQPEKGRLLLEKALKVQKKKAGSEYALTLFRMGELERRESNLEAAVPYLKKSYQVRYQTMGECPETVYAAFQLATVLKDLHRYEEALDIYQEAKQMLEKIYSPDAPEMSGIYYGINELYYDLCDYDRAEDSIMKALEIDRRTYGEPHPKVVRDMNDLALIYLARGEIGRAEETCKKSLRLIEEIDPEVMGDDVFVLTFEARLYLSRVFLAKGDKKAALDELSGVHDTLKNLRLSRYPTRVDQETMFGMAFQTTRELDLLSDADNEYLLEKLEKSIYSGDFETSARIMNSILLNIQDRLSRQGRN